MSISIYVLQVQTKIHDKHTYIRDSAVLFKKFNLTTYQNAQMFFDYHCQQCDCFLFEKN